MLILPKFELFTPETLEETLELLSKYGSDAKLLAGGTELLPLLRTGRIKTPKYVVSLAKLQKQLSYVREEGEYIRIGALTTIWDLSQSFLARDKRYAGFIDAFQGFGTISIRFMATLGGNIVSATQYSDYITLLLVYDAIVKLRSTKGEREVKLENFVIDKRRVDLKPEELVVEIYFKKPSENCSSSFMKFDRRRLLIAGIVTGAAYMCLDGDTITDIRISFDMVRDKRTPSRAKKVEEFLRGKKFSEELLREAAEKVLPTEMVRISDWWTNAEYRLEMSKVVLRRNLLRIYERIRGGE
ncbi:MAG: FAD binding domain-containing protein [Thermoprotei archaeon]